MHTTQTKYPFVFKQFKAENNTKKQQQQQQYPDQTKRIAKITAPGIHNKHERNHVRIVGDHENCSAQHAPRKQIHNRFVFIGDTTRASKRKLNLILYRHLKTHIVPLQSKQRQN